MINMNSLNLRQVCGGDTIKQADFGSELAFELLDEQYVKFREPLGESAKVILKKDNTAVYMINVPIINNTVSFKFNKILPVGSYVLEIIVGDYVFPSNNRVVITIEQTYGQFEPEYLVSVSYEELKADVDDLKSKVQSLESDEKDVITYDDTPIIKRIEKLEASVTRRAPTGYTLERTTTPWTVWFDNGCGMTIPEYGTTASIYGYGQAQNAYNNNFSSYPLPPTIMSVSHGTLTIEKIKTIEGSCNFWASGITIINPIRDRNDYDWTNARFNKASLDYAGDPYYSYKYVRQQYFIRTMYELGIWSGEIVEEFGATKK